MNFDAGRRVCQQLIHFGELFEINVDEMLIVWNHNLLSGLDSLLRTGLKNSTNYPLKKNSFSKQRNFWAKWQNCDSLIFNAHRQGFTRSGGNNKLLFPKIFQQPDNSKDTSATRFFTNQMIKKLVFPKIYFSKKNPTRMGHVVTWLPVLCRTPKFKIYHFSKTGQRLIFFKCQQENQISFRKCQGQITIFRPPHTHTHTHTHILQKHNYVRKKHLS